jgi:hypothetical protein
MLYFLFHDHCRDMNFKNSSVTLTYKGEISKKGLGIRREDSYE